MGLLAFLQRRQSDKTSLSSSPSTLTLQRSNTSALPLASKSRSRSDADLLSRHHTNRHQLLPEASRATPPRTATRSGESQRPWQSESIASSSNSAKRMSSASSSYSSLLLSRTATAPGTHTLSVAGRHVDLLDAHGQIGLSNFKARLQASGSRDYGEDVAERNIGQNGLLLGSPAVQKFYAARSAQVVTRRQSTSAAKYHKYANKEVILEQPEDEDAYRPSSRASSLHTARSLPMRRVRVTSIFESPVCTETRRASVASIGLPKLEEGSSARKEVEAAEESDDAFPPSIPRFRRSEAEQSGERPSSALGSVRRARQSVDVISAYHIGEPIKDAPMESMMHDDGANKRPASRNQRSSPASHQQNLSIENMLRWRQSFGDRDEDQRSVATERATDSRASQRHCWSVASTEPTERSDVSSVSLRPVSRATVTTSVDIRSLMDLDESAKARTSCDVDRAQQDEDDSCSLTTDGSDIDAFVEKRRRRRGAPEDEALLFDESGFFNGGGCSGAATLPGLFGGAASGRRETPPKQQQSTKRASVSTSKRNSSQTLKGHPRIDDAAQKPVDMLIPEDARPMSRLGSPLGLALDGAAPGEEEDDDADGRGRCSSVEPGGALVPQMYLTRRQRLLALGFDYDTDDEPDGDESPEDKTTRRQRLSSSPLPRLSIIVEAPPSRNSQSDAAARRRKGAKKLTRGGGPRARVRRVETVALEEGDGNLADME